MTYRSRFLILTCAAALSLVLASAARADFTVNTLADGSDANVGDTICEATSGMGDCTLAAAVQEASFSGPADVITFSITGVHNLSDPLVVNSPMTFDGNGSGPTGTVLDGADGHRLVSIGNAATSVTLKDLRLQNGQLSNPNGAGGGAVVSDASLSLVNVVATSNGITGTGSGTGGAISMGGSPDSLSVTDSTISGNTISSAGNNEGGGVFANSSPLTLTRSTVSGNSITAGTSSVGGGIVANGDLSVTDSTISGNSIASGPFGAFGGGISSALAGTKTIVNSTISGNTAGSGTSGTGGGAVFFAAASVINTTLAGNSADGSGHDLRSEGGAVTLKNTILASGAEACSAISGGSFASATPGNNIDSGTSCGLGTTLGNRQSTDALLGPLQPNGGPTETRAITTSSPAFNTATPDCGGLAADQRGISRPQPAGGVCDVGAFELEQAAPPAGPSATPPPAKKKCKKGRKLKKGKCVKKKRKKG